jgi:hypothetical protein
MNLVLMLLMFVWLSTATILLPLPWLLEPSLATSAVWIQWIAKLSLVLLGIFATGMALWREGKWLLGTAVMSAVYLAYWASEYLLATRPALDTFASVVHAIKDLDGLPPLVLLQLQIVWPTIHFLALLYVVFYASNRRGAGNR